MFGRRRRGLAALSLCAAVAVAAATPAAGKAIQFQYQYEEGSSFKHKVKFTQEVWFGTFSRSQIVDLEVTEKCVGKTEDGKFKMEMVFNKVESSLMMFDQMQEDQLGAGLTGQSVSYIVDSHGEVSEIRAMGYIEAWERMSAAVEGLLNGWYAYLPAEEVAVGDGWTQNKTEEEEGLVTETEAEFTFEEMKEEVGRECGKVEAETELVISGTTNTPMGTFDAEGTGEGKFEFAFDPTALVVVKLKGKIEIKMDMTPSSGKGDKVETTVNIEMERELE
jgi:hypothetical protein